MFKEKRKLMFRLVGFLFVRDVVLKLDIFILSRVLGFEYGWGSKSKDGRRKLICLVIKSGFWGWSGIFFWFGFLDCVKGLV